MSRDAIIAALRLRAAGTPERLPDHFLEGRGTDQYWHPQSRCEPCAKKKAEDDGKDHDDVVRHDGEREPVDSLNSCADCGVATETVLTDEGCDGELDFWDERGGPKAADEWAELLVVATSLEDDDEEREGRIAAILANTSIAPSAPKETIMEENQDHRVEVVRIVGSRKHENADSLSVAHVKGYPVVYRTEDFAEGDTAVYVPIDSVVPIDDARWAHLKGKARIKAVRLRQVFSMGMFTKADPSWEVGREVSAELGITRYDPPEPAEGNEADPGFMSSVTVHRLRGNPGVLVPGEEVVLTEKIEGETFRATFQAGRLWVGSRTAWKDPSYATPGYAGAHFWQVAGQLDMERRLRDMPEIGIIGEVYGDVSGMKYDARSDARKLRLFDAVHIRTRTMLNYDAFLDVARKLELPTVPELYRGPWGEDLYSFANGKSTFGNHVREGFVVRPVRERRDDTLGRVILKLHGEDYLLRK